MDAENEQVSVQNPDSENQISDSEYEISDSEKATKTDSENAQIPIRKSWLINQFKFSDSENLHRKSEKHLKNP